MYTTSDFRRGLRIEIDGTPYSIIEFEHHKPGKGAAITRCRLRNLLTGQVTAPTMRSGEKVGQPDVEDKDGQFLFASGDTYTFMDPKTYEQYEISKEMLGESTVRVSVGLIQDQVDEVEAAQKRRRQLDVFHHRSPRVVARLNRIGRGQY